jgi:hypothetical protein
MKRLLGALIVIAALLAFGDAAPSNAALQLPEGIQEQLTVDISPTIPGPNESVTIGVRSFSSNLNASDIYWYVDGAPAASGRGMTSFTTTIGDVGTETRVFVRIAKVDGGEVAREIVFSPADLELVFEALTYTPPFYEGRSIMTHQAPYKVVAIPRFIDTNGKRYSEKELVYTWKVNGRNVPEATGYGSYTMTSKGALVSRAFDVTVEAQTPDGSIIAKKTIFIEPEEAELLLYENNPLYGVLYNRAVDETVDLGSESSIDLKASPLYFGVESASAETLTYDWRIDDKAIIAPRNEDELSLQVPEGEGLAGTNIVSVQARNMDDILQAGYRALTLTFGEVIIEDEYDF